MKNLLCISGSFGPKQKNNLPINTYCFWYNERKLGKFKGLFVVEQLPKREGEKMKRKEFSLWGYPH